MQWPEPGTHHLLPLPSAGWLSSERSCEILSFSPSCSKELQKYFYSTIISTSSHSHSVVLSSRGCRPSFPQDDGLQVLQPLPSLGGQFRFSARSCFSICWSNFELCSPRPVMLTPSALSPKNFLTPHLPLPPGADSQLGWVFSKGQMRAWSRNHQHCLGPKPEQWQGFVSIPSVKFLNYWQALSRSMCELATPWPHCTPIPGSV